MASPVLIQDCAAEDRLPLVFDSPHSGCDYPDDFNHACPRHVLRQTEDTHVEALMAGAPHHGAALVEANFPRAYIDANRGIEDIDLLLLNQPWPYKAVPSDKSRLGYGLIRRVAEPGMMVYNRRLSVAEIEDRIRHYWQPYHDALESVIDARYQAFGAVWLVNCHSMPSGVGHVPPHTAAFDRADFVLGDRDGTSCSPAFTRLAAAALRRLGYSVKVNDPYKGVEIVRRWGRPAEGLHALQLEINRRLYMDEMTLERLPGFDRLKADLERLMATLAAYVRDQLVAAAAD